MRRSDRFLRLILPLAAALIAARPVGAADPAAAAWVQMTETGAEVRAVVASGGCPEAVVAGRPLRLSLRAAADADFPAVCSAAVPPHASTVQIDGRSLRTPAARVRRIVLFGDSGCRIKGPLTQACNDPRAWPFAEVARRAAARKPDLVIHLGDYYYRESACPVGDLGCAGSPAGDRWSAWAADFFDPARPLLASAPWVFVRGNHESCSRGGEGWFRLLDAAATARACPTESGAWSASIGGLKLYVLDSADMPDRDPPPGKIADFARQLDSLGAELKATPGWILVHRPVWGIVPVARLGPIGPLNVALNATEQAAVRARDLTAVRAVVSGHVHDFSSFDFGGRRPAQLVVGTGGDVGEAADTPRIVRDTVSLDDLDAARTEFDRFGYMVLDRIGEGADDWKGVFYDAHDRAVVDCRLTGRRLSCTPAPGAAR